jgi:hypothetical protein
MSLIKCLAFVSLALTLPALHSEPRCPGNTASLRFHLAQRSRIVVPVVINHTGPYEFLVDTGSLFTTLDPSLATELHLKAQGSIGVDGIGFSTDSSFGYLGLLEAGSQSVANHLVLMHDLQPLQAADLHFRGILGGDFLGHFDVLMDYAHRMLCLDDAKVMLAPELRQTGQRDGYGSDGVKRGFPILPPQSMQIGSITIQEVFFAAPADSEENALTSKEDGLLTTGLFRRVFISYADRFVVLDPW